MRLLTASAVSAVLALSLVSGAVTARTPAPQAPAQVQAGTYNLDPSHGKITFAVNHLGFSTYRGQFVNVTAQLTLNPANPAASVLTATVPMADVKTNHDALDTHLKSPDFFNVARYPTATYVSRSVTVNPTDPTRATVVGDLTLRGVTKPVTLSVKFNKAGPYMAQRARAGFDAEATVKRSDFGIVYGVPDLGDNVVLNIEGEFVLQ